MDFRKTGHGVCLPGFRAGGVKRGKYGVALIVSDIVCEAAVVSTRNNVKAAPLRYNSRILESGVQAVVANSGNANCCVREGIRDAELMAAEASAELGVKARDVAVASTGIIGRRMDMKSVKALIVEAAAKISPTPKGSLQAAKAIMTTDKRIKMYSAEYRGIRAGGICKGSGMISPNMATMLCFITTNASFPKSKLSAALKEAVEDSFNMISVDGDMSTNDTVLLLSNRTEKCSYGDFKALLKHVCVEMAKMIPRDGEGASKFIEVEVRGGRSNAEARKAVKSVIDSTITKCAFYGENPNWGRILSSIGSAVKFDEMNVDVTFQSGKKSAKVFSGGRCRRLDSARKILANRNIRVVVDLHRGRHGAVGWMCDITPDYVRINAEYN
ncbi:MAG: bifunctional glutamate N-acetyltransferase/amino-acid acetyltransferase ArgJ [Candidatus Altiarchaeales archaeon]|nr:bifunctional glutamate N-acetyltransferase/amino-acid acetyltransferase ArgJ [Candidatus Altiarchaeales archaeon]MBD3416543.1 bifunctional glutamate N-acetyltransferase/amino-acid acetyltransferase ArgJ [Candidatus Altiarchaeales archaeon]